MNTALCSRSSTLLAALTFHALLLGPIFLAAPAGASEAERGADLLLYGGTIYTLQGETPTPVEALAVRDGRVIGAGSRAGCEALCDARTERIDLAGATAVPGLTDAHAHLFNLGTFLGRVSLVGTASSRECVAKAKEFARGLPENAWLLGRGWDQNDWQEQTFPSRYELDEAFPERPVILERVDGHAAWANSAALRAAGIDASTPDPEGGEILREDEAETPSGIVIDEAEELLWAALPEPDAAEWDRRLQLAQNKAVANGLCGVHEMGATVERIAALRRARAAGTLKLRMTVYLSGEETLRQWNERPDHPGHDDLLRIEGVKLYADGALGSRGAALLADYIDRPGHRGFLRHSHEELTRQVSRAFARGFGVAIHAIGDAANRQCLDAIRDGYRLAKSSHPELLPLPEMRARIEHSQILSPADIPRFAQLGIIPSMQPTHCTSDMPWAESRLGKARLAGAYAWRSLRETGCILPLGSDFPVERVSPLLGLYAAITRKAADGTGPKEGWSKEQCLSPTEALVGFTAWAAEAGGSPSLGHLAEGEWADVTVLNCDPLRDDPQKLLHARVLRTIVDGKTVYAASTSADR